MNVAQRDLAVRSILGPGDNAERVRSEKPDVQQSCSIRNRRVDGLSAAYGRCDEEEPYRLERSGEQSRTPRRVEKREVNGRNDVCESAELGAAATIHTHRAAAVVLNVSARWFLLPRELVIIGGP